MFDHVGIRVENFGKSKEFYKQALAPLGIKPMFGEEGVFYGFGKDRPQFWISTSDAERMPSHNVHIAFASESRDLVDKFYEIAVAAGARDNGKPGVRTEYHEHYYGAFVLDEDGNNIEVVCHNPA